MDAGRDAGDALNIRTDSNLDPIHAPKEQGIVGRTALVGSRIGVFVPGMEIWVLALALSCSLLAAHWSLLIIPYPDEFTIVQPAMVRLFGYEPGPSMFPPGIIAFFEGWLRFINLFLQLEFIQPQKVVLWSRLANIIIYAVNILLFYLLARKFLKNKFVLLACFIFALNFPVFFSATVTKSDEMTLFWVLVGLLIFDNIATKNDNMIMHIFSGVVCAMAICTKYNATLIIAYIGAMFCIWDRKSDSFAKFLNKLNYYKLFAFTISFFVVMLFVWPDFYRVIEKLDHLSKDWYFSDVPLFFKAVSEWNAFPYGRYSYALLIILLWLAPVAYPSMLAALFARVLPRRILFIQGAFSLGFLVLLINTTLWYTFYNFVSIMPFVAICSTLFWQKMMLSKKIILKLSGTFLIILAILLSVLQYNTIPTLLVQIQNFSGDLQYEAQQSEKNGEKFIIVAYIRKSIVLELPAEAIENAISMEKPDRLLILDSYYYSLLKYKTSPNRPLGLYLKSLVEDEKDYEIYRVVQLHFPLKRFVPDPEASMKFYFLKRRPETKSEQPTQGLPRAPHEGSP